MNYTVNYRGEKIEIQKLKNGKFKIPQEIKKLSGAFGGWQPKPAWETIIVAMKPLSKKTYVDQAMKNGKGITWLDSCRIPYESEGDKESIFGGISKNTFSNKKYEGDILKANPQGRFPANILVSDDVLNDGRITKSGSGAIRKNTKQDGSVGFMAGTQEGMKMKEYADSGSFSRYFDLDKWWAKTFPFLIVPKASKSEKNKGLEGFEEHKIKRLSGGKYQHNSGSLNSEKDGGKSKNHHPTVKPIKLMSYLIMLASREGDIVLDPFVGSGTTAIAAKQLKRDYIGIDLSQEYCEIAEARLGAIPQTLF